MKKFARSLYALLALTVFVASAASCGAERDRQGEHGPTTSVAPASLPIEQHLRTAAEHAQARRAFLLAAYVYVATSTTTTTTTAPSPPPPEEQERYDVQQQETVARAVEESSGRCGGVLPPCYVMQRESGGDIRAENPVSSASGKWQFIDGTWDGYGGYAHASDAPEEVQDAKARETWAGGAGCSHWQAC
jgi:Transglycosylase-like domain